jgi:hypothetical protein
MADIANSSGQAESTQPAALEMLLKLSKLHFYILPSLVDLRPTLDQARALFQQFGLQGRF